MFNWMMIRLVLDFYCACTLRQHTTSICSFSLMPTPVHDNRCYLKHCNNIIYFSNKIANAWITYFNNNKVRYNKISC